MPTRPTARLVCSFCGKAYHQVRKLIAGPTLYICDECIKLCNDILAEEKTKKVAVEAEPHPKKEVKAGKSPPRCCSFCGKEQREVTALIAGQSDCICDECIGLCNDIIREEIEAIEAADTLKARVPEDIRALIAGIVEQALPAVEGAREVLDRRIREDTRPPDRLIWTASGLASDWERLHKILRMATPDESIRPDGDLASRSLGSPEGQVTELPGWVAPIVEALRGTSEVLGVLARRIEEPGLEEVLRPSLHLAREKLDEARELLLAGPPKPPLD